jgi:mxaC protein
VNLAFAHPLWLVLLPLALLPFLLPRERPVPHASLALLPRDRLSRIVSVLLRVAPALLIVLLLAGIAGLHRPPVLEPRTGSGAQIVMLLDRSRSMDQKIAAGRRLGEYVNTAAALASGAESKGEAARRLLLEFVRRRQDDMYAMTIFSSSPIPVLSLTDSREMVEAAITAGNVGRGLASTDIGAGLKRALNFFEGREYTGSRLILLISDGGAKLDVATRFELSNLFARYQVTLYWLYVRSGFGKGIFGNDAEDESTAPARALHRFFSELDTPYRAYDAEDSEALERAIDDVNRLQSLPIVYRELVPRRDLSGYCFAASVPFLLIVWLGQLLQVRTWSIH